MKRGKRSADDRARSRLLDAWQCRSDYGEPIGCVATSFTFDAAFFEEQCLARFLGMETDSAEDERGYRIEREEKLAPTFCAVIVDHRHIPLTRSLRWHAFGARVPREAAFHPKLSLLVWRERVRVMIGSANLNDAGYRKNLENAGRLDFTPDGDLPHSLLLGVLDFLDEIRGFAPGKDIADGPQAQLHRFLETVRGHVRGWNERIWPRGEPSVTLALTGPGHPSLFEQLRALWPFAPATEATVMSPFFDRGDGALVTAESLESLLIQRGDRRIYLIVPGRRMPDESIELDMPSALARSRRPRTTYHHQMVVPAEGEEPRSLHAKSLWIQRDDQALYCMGSSNFTQPGCGLSDSGPINVEANLVYVLPSLAADFARVCERAYPSTESVDLDAHVIKYLELEDRTPEPTSYVVLPDCFGAATLRVEGEERWLDLEIVADPPLDFAVALASGAILLRASEWVEAGRPRLVPRRLDHSQPPSYVGVMWGVGIEQLRAIWPINAQDTSALPAPAELRDLSLEELLEVLTSARPAHETIGRVQTRREARGSRSQEGIPTDPHRRIDTRHHLLKRMRRASAAMEELRVRIERPSFSREALRSRLYGPLGPRSLAEKLIAEEPVGAAFLIAELASTVGTARLEPRGELSAEQARALVADVLRELQALAAQHPAPANLRAYVAATFEEVVR